MRQRQIKDIDRKIAEHAGLLLRGGGECFSLGDALPYLELGCGRGRFINELARMFPEREFIGAEGNPSVLYRALQKTAENGLANVHYIAEYVDDVRAYFGEGGLAGIYLNFSDPWPKDRHEKRRLTAAPRIAAYGEVVTQGGFVALKTDNEDFFEFSLEAFAAGGFETLHVTRDLHGAGELTGLPPEAQVMTEYEIKFTGIGKRIGYFLAVRP